MFCALMGLDCCPFDIMDTEPIVYTVQYRAIARFSLYLAFICRVYMTVSDIEAVIGRGLVTAFFHYKEE